MALTSFLVFEGFLYGVWNEYGYPEIPAQQ